MKIYLNAPSESKQTKKEMKNLCEKTLKLMNIKQAKFKAYKVYTICITYYY